MKKFLIGLMMSIITTTGFAQSYPSPTYNNLNVVGYSIQQNPNNLYGTYSKAAASAIIADCSSCLVQVNGFTSPSQVATYTSRDSVASYISNQDRAPLITLTSPTYDTTHVYPASALSPSQVASIRIGAFIETNASPKYTGIITAVAANGTSITVSGWFQSGNTASGQTPTGSTAYVDVMTDVFAANFDATYTGAYAQGLGVHTVEDDMNQNTTFTQGNVFTTLGDSPVSNIHQIACNSGACGSGLDIYGTIVRGILIRNASTGGFIYGPTSGAPGFLSDMTSGDIFANKNTSYVNTLTLSAPSTVNLGTQSGGSPTTPTLNLYSSAQGNPDSAISSFGGNSTAYNGALQLIGASVRIYGPSTVSGDDLQVSAGGSGSGAVLTVQSPSTNSPLTIQSQGTGTVLIAGNSSGFNSNVVNFVPVAVTGTGQVNSMNILNGLTGTAPTLHMTGVDTNISLNVQPKGSGTFQVNGVSMIPNLTGTSGSIGGSSLAAGACSSGTVSITGATTAMGVVATPATYPGDGNYWNAYVSSSGTVTVKVCATVSGTPTASAYNVRVLQ
jgi:hypothetical protein